MSFGPGPPPARYVAVERPGTAVGDEAGQRLMEGGDIFKQPKEGLGFDGSAVAHMWRTMIWPNNLL